MFVLSLKIKEAYLLPMKDLKDLLATQGGIATGQKTIRGTPHDAVIIGHFTLDSKQDKSNIKNSGLDGFYSYSAVNGAHFASTWKNWAACKLFARNYDLLFVPTVSPGYQDKSKERNIKYNSSLRHRSNGEYFGVGWRTAQGMNAQFIMINSYNNFVEGKRTRTFYLMDKIVLSLRIYIELVVNTRVFVQ